MSDPVVIIDEVPAMPALNFSGTGDVWVKPVTYSRRGWNRKLRRLELAMKAHTEPTTAQLQILAALQTRPMYAGTVTAKVKASRRSLNSRQKASRRANRG